MFFMLLSLLLLPAGVFLLVIFYSLHNEAEDQCLRLGNLFEHSLSQRGFQLWWRCASHEDFRVANSKVTIVEYAVISHGAQ